jgi:hypothetical protein
MERHDYDLDIPGLPEAVSGTPRTDKHVALLLALRALPQLGTIRLAKVVEGSTLRKVCITRRQAARRRSEPHARRKSSPLDIARRHYTAAQALDACSWRLAGALMSARLSSAGVPSTGWTTPTA